MASYFPLIFLLLVLPFPSHSSDPSPLQDFCVADLKSPLSINGYPCKNPSKITSKDFFHEGLTQNPNDYNSLGVDLLQVSVDQFPALNTMGMSMNRVAFQPGGLNPPHIHARATELSLVTEGKLFVGWISTDYVMYWKIMSAGELFIIPPGLVHFQLNVGKGNARFYASFNSQKPGLQILGQALFNVTPMAIPDEVLTKALLVNQTIIDLIKSKFAQQ
ncbi:hypothetical protein M9H77_04815 [Catharanthus roseus]|uniref:Uncharacterized protein n=1 Tax=Catharanthus roseus TaxID=4058 RepID=A0ACC0CF49_CATRO|nr:hypothetical protein M9H77_04815 [Catharanthus roseus]